MMIAVAAPVLTGIELPPQGIRVISFLEAANEIRQTRLVLVASPQLARLLLQKRQSRVGVLGRTSALEQGGEQQPLAQRR
jgi:hypothetical protein